jgi:hypothetical protein
MTLSLKSFEYPMLLLFYIFEYLAIDTGSAPDFMDKEKYMAWLMGELLI